MKHRKSIISFVLALILLLSVPAGGAMAVYVNGTQVDGTGLYILDFETGTELYSYNGDTPMIPASLTKLMSLYLVYEAMEDGVLDGSDEVPVSENTYRLSRDPEFYSNIELSYEETYYVAELLELIVVNSSNVGVVMLAEMISGTEESFVARMNSKAREMGLSAVFFESVGISDDNRISPRSVALLAQKLISDYPEILALSSKPSTVFHGKTYKSTNYLLSSQYYQGADGLKTGTTTLAGYCFCGTAERGGVRLITVVLKSSSNTQRFTDAMNLLDYGFKIRGNVIRDAAMRLEPFTDVYIDDWFAEGVAYAYGEGLMTGTSETRFDPGLTLSRAMVATVLHRLSGAPEASQRSQFADVADGQWYSEAIDWAYASGIVSGYSDTEFGTGDNITREQLAAMLFRYSDYMGLDLTSEADLTSFYDAGSISVWAKPAMSWAIGNELLTGTTASTLSPGSSATRAQCATILYRFLIVYADIAVG